MHLDGFVACLTGLALDPRPEEEEALRRRVSAHGERMRPPHGLLDLSLVPTVDRLIVDGRPVPAGRLLGVTAGEHVVRAERAGHERWETRFVVRPGVTVRLSGVLVLRAAEPSAPDRLLPVALFIGGGLAIVTGAAMHAVARSGTRTTRRGTRNLGARAPRTSGASGIETRATPERPPRSAPGSGLAPARP